MVVLGLRVELCDRVRDGDWLLVNDWLPESVEETVRDWLPETLSLEVGELLGL